MRHAHHFRASSFCSGGDCIGVAVDEHAVALARLDDGITALTVSREEWAAFVAGVKAGEFDLD